MPLREHCQITAHKSLELHNYLLLRTPLWRPPEAPGRQDRDHKNAHDKTCGGKAAARVAALRHGSYVCEGDECVTKSRVKTAARAVG